MINNSCYSYKSQLNVENVGAVMASPDDDPDYYYHWMRDGALSIKVQHLMF